MNHQTPIRPQQLTSSDTPGGATSSQAGMTDPGAADDEVDLREALVDDPIVGIETVVFDEHGPGALEARPLRTPPAMTPAEKEKHDLTPQPPHPGCPICASSRTHFYHFYNNVLALLGKQKKVA